MVRAQLREPENEALSINLLGAFFLTRLQIAIIPQGNAGGRLLSCAKFAIGVLQQNPYYTSRQVLDIEDHTTEEVNFSGRRIGNRDTVNNY